MLFTILDFVLIMTCCGVWDNDCEIIVQPYYLGPFS